MSVTRPNTLIPYFTAYIIQYFYNSKTTGDRQKPIADLESPSKIRRLKLIKNNK